MRYVLYPAVLLSPLTQASRSQLRLNRSGQLLKRERIKRKSYLSRDAARADIFDNIKMFYNPVRRHGHNQGLSPVQFEQQFLRRDSCVSIKPGAIHHAH
jgi:transposase InsO family protein